MQIIFRRGVFDGEGWFYWESFPQTLENSSYDLKNDNNLKENEIKKGK